VYGLSCLFALTAAAIALLLLRRERTHLWSLALILICLPLPDLAAPQTPSESAVVVQPNMPEEEQWTQASAGAARDHFMKLSLDSALRLNPRIIVWPEVPGPFYYYRDPNFHEQAAVLARYSHAYFLFRTVAETPQGAPLNSAVLLRPDGDLEDRYDKINLVPFGEYVPKVFSFVNRITQEAGDFAPGKRLVVFPADGHRLGVFICYESVFPAEVREFVKNGANVLLNLSNDGYFGQSAAREQHLEIARMRAVENRRWLLRVTNDGISAAIDPAGRVTQRLPMYREAVARMNYSYISETTFYTKHGDWFAWGCLLAGAVALFCSQFPHYTPRKRPA
jgi:apolipoprotein N-acyltransferase